MGDITAANAVITFTVPLLLPFPTQIQGFAADDVFDTEEVNSVETLMGVDGTLSGGMVFEETMWTITLQADSPSVTFFEAWDTGQTALIGVAPGILNVTLTSIGRSYQVGTAFLKKLNRMPSAKKVLQPRKFHFGLGQIIPIPVGIAG